MMDTAYVRSLKNIVKGLPNNKNELIDQIRMLLGFSKEDFENFLKILDKAKYSRVEFEVFNTELELSKILDGPLEVHVKISTADTEISVRYVSQLESNEGNKNVVKF